MLIGLAVKHRFNEAWLSGPRLSQHGELKHLTKKVSMFRFVIHTSYVTYDANTMHSFLLLFPVFGLKPEELVSISVYNICARMHHEIS